MILDWGAHSFGYDGYSVGITPAFYNFSYGAAITPSEDCATPTDVQNAILNLLDVQEVAPGVTVRQALAMITKTLKTTTYFGTK